MKSGFVLLSRDDQLTATAVAAAATAGIELRLLEQYPVISATEFLIADLKALIDHPTLRPDLLISTELTDSIWRYAATYAPAQLVQLPQAASWFQTWLTSQHSIKSPLICIRSVTAVSALGVFLTQLNLIDTAHNAARAAARGQQIDLPANVSLTQQLQNGAILIVVRRDLDFWSKAIELTATAEVIVE